MQDSELVQRFESSGDLNEDTPELIFCEFGVIFYMMGNFGVKVALISKLHDDTLNL